MNPCMYNIQNLLGGKVANGVRADVEAVGDLSLGLADGFTLLLRDVLYVLSLQRNLISVSCLNNDGYDCHFGNGKCKITINNACVGLAILQNELYLLSLRDDVNVVSDDGTLNATMRMYPRLRM